MMIGYDDDVGDYNGDNVDASDDKDTRNCPEKAMKISHNNPNQSAPSIYIMIELRDKDTSALREIFQYSSSL